jgi:hypothetical protein
MSSARIRTQQMSSSQLLTIATNLLHKAFHDCPRVDAKRRYRALEEGKKVFLIEMQSPDGGQVRVTMSLDRSEFRGRFSFSLLRDLVAQLLARFSTALTEKSPLNTFSDEQRQRCVFLLPAVCENDDAVNMLVLAVDVGTLGAMELALMFIDPAQFRRDEAAAG